MNRHSDGRESDGVTVRRRVTYHELYIQSILSLTLAVPKTLNALTGEVIDKIVEPKTIIQITKSSNPEQVFMQRECNLTLMFTNRTTLLQVY